MKVSFNITMYASAALWLPCRSLEQTIGTLAGMGYDGVEIGAAAPHAYPDYLDASQRVAVVRLADRAGIEISAICPSLGGGPGFNPASPDEAERQASLEYMIKCIRLASDLECDRVIWLAGWTRYGQPRAEAWNFAAANLRRCAEVAAPLGVSLAVEPTPEVSDLVDHAGDALRMIVDAGVDEGMVGVMLDSIHVFVRQDDLRAAFREAGDRLTYVHVSDLHRDPPGTHMDFGSLVAELREIGYDGWLALEVGFNRRASDPDGIARAGLAHMREVLGPSGGPS